MNTFEEMPANKEPFDRKLVGAIREVFDEFASQYSLGTSAELTKIYFSIHPLETLAVDSELLKAAQANQDKDQIIGSLTAQVKELLSRLEKRDTKLIRDARAYDDIKEKYLTVAVELEELKYVADMRSYQSFANWVEQSGGYYIKENKPNRDEQYFKDLWDKYRW